MKFLYDYAGDDLLDEDGRRYFEGNQVIFQNVDEYDHQVNGDIGVIVSIANAPDERDQYEYMAVWLYKSHKVVRAFESDVLHHKSPDDYFDDDVKLMLYDLDWWVRPPCYETPPIGTKLSDFVDPHTGNEFSLGDCVVIEENYVLSTFDRLNDEVNIGDKCVLLDSLYESNKKGTSRSIISGFTGTMKNPLLEFWKVLFVTKK